MLYTIAQLAGFALAIVCTGIAACLEVGGVVLGLSVVVTAAAAEAGR